MPSHSSIKFNDKLLDLFYLREASKDFRLRPIKEIQKQIYLHSYLTGLVAAWDAYVKSVVREYFTLVSNPLDVRYSSLYSLLNNHVLKALDKLNTPNAENARNFLIASTGYDPFNDWIWKPRAFTAQATRERLNEIFKVRHSFAHGFTMPSYPWNTSSSGKVRLTQIAVDDARELVKYLVLSTDNGLARFLMSVHSISVGW